MGKLYITGMGLDRPGMVASITDVIFKYKGNIEESSMTILANQFTFIVIASFDSAETIAKVKQAYNDVQADKGCTVFVQHIDDNEESPHITQFEETPYMISIAGNDRTGITAYFTKILAMHQGSITDLNARTIDGENGPAYVLMIECLLPKHLNRSQFEQDLAKQGEALNVEVTYHPIEAVAL